MPESTALPLALHERGALVRALNALLQADRRACTYHDGIASNIRREKPLPESEDAATLRAIRDRLEIAAPPESTEEEEDKADLESQRDALVGGVKSAFAARRRADAERDSAVNLLREALETYSAMTSLQFAAGADRPLRQKIAAFLGLDLDSELFGPRGL